MARRKSTYDLGESDPVPQEDPPADTESTAGFDKKEATLQLRRHMVAAEGEDADWHPVTVQVSAEVNQEDASNYQNFDATSEQVEGIVLNDEEMDMALQALGIEPVEDTMTEEEHDALLEEDTEEEEV